MPRKALGSGPGSRGRRDRASGRLRLSRTSAAPDLDSRRELVAARARVRVLSGAPDLPRARIRRTRTGDLGWAFQRQATLYRHVFRYGAVFETYLAQGIAAFLEGLDTTRDAAWVAEVAGAPVGFVAIQHDPERAGWAKLRWYFVEPRAQGKGIGGRLLRTAVSFARGTGYRGILLWTVNDLAGARRQYERAGFSLAHEASEQCAWAPWGREQRWDLVLDGRKAGTSRSTGRFA